MSRIEELIKKIDANLDILIEGFHSLSNRLDRILDETQKRASNVEMSLTSVKDQIDISEVSLGSRIDETNIRLSQVDRRLERLETPRSFRRNNT